MLKPEFEERIGRKAESEEYDRANKMYMTTNVGKEEFCAEWEKGLKDSAVAHAMAAVADYNLSRAEIENQMRKDAEKEAETLTKVNGMLQETISGLKARVEVLDEENAEKDGRIMDLEEQIENLEAEKATLYKILEKFLDK